ncbi:MAG: M48 family peptidase [Nitrospirae bacterium]|nr:MAG: M48 family peptidase [Nitrospirota bacterium]
MKEFSGFVTYGKEKVPFDVTYVDRKTMEIAVHPNGSVTIRAPKGTAQKTIRDRLAKRARWVIKQINFFRKFEPLTPARQFLGGETHLFLGRQYRLKIRSQKTNTVKLKGAYFLITTPDAKDSPKIKDLLDSWYKEHARLIFSRRLEECYKRAERLSIPYPEIRLRKMVRRWGSCSKSGDILLNTSLVKAPLSCIDYVIMHELCHLKIHTHTNSYFKFLSKLMPDWEKRKERLEKFMS